MSSIEVPNEFKKILGKRAFTRMVRQRSRNGEKVNNHPDLTMEEVLAWKAQDDAATEEMLSMKKLYQEKSRDYS